MIENLIFDFGNVLYKLDIENCHSKLANLCGLQSDELLNKIAPILQRYEKGEIGDENFIWHLQQYNQTVNPREFVEAWNSMLLGIESHIPQLLSNLAEQYNLYLLSNINGLHARHVDRYLQKRLNEPDFLSRYFKQYFYSHQIHLRKPDLEIYKYVTDQISATPSSILFIDDNRDNISAAITFGWKAQWHDPNKNLRDCIDQYLNDAN